MEIRRGVLPLVAVLCGVLPACSDKSSSQPTGGVTSKCDSIEVARFKELVVVDDAVMNDARTSNATGGPWSFRYLVGQLAPTDPQTFVKNWIYEFAYPNTVNGYAVPVRTHVMEDMICPWLKRTPSNQCDDTCSTCTSNGVLDLAQAPFRLIAIVNRMDLLQEPDEPAPGESRFVFALMDRAADDPAAQPLEMTMILEYALPGTTQADVSAWAARWHALGSQGDFDDGYKQALEALTHKFTDIGADPSRPNVVSFGQARTNERAFDWQWQMREYHLINGQMTLSPTARTPDASVNYSTQLADFIKANHDAIMANTFELPIGLLGGAISPFQWQAPGIDETTRHAFAVRTCNGCHQTENPSVDINFHISPHRSGVARLSPFLNNPADPAHDDLARRTELMRQELCAQ